MDHRSIRLCFNALNPTLSYTFSTPVLTPFFSRSLLSYPYFIVSFCYTNKYARFTPILHIGTKDRQCRAENDVWSHVLYVQSICACTIWLKKRIRDFKNTCSDFLPASAKAVSPSKDCDDNPVFVIRSVDMSYCDVRDVDPCVTSVTAAKTVMCAFIYVKWTASVKIGTVCGV